MEVTSITNNRQIILKNVCYDSICSITKNLQELGYIEYTDYVCIPDVVYIGGVIDNANTFNAKILIFNPKLLNDLRIKNVLLEYLV